MPESPARFYIPDPKFRQALAEVAESQKAFVSQAAWVWTIQKDEKQFPRC